MKETVWSQPRLMASARLCRRKKVKGSSLAPYHQTKTLTQYFSTTTYLIHHHNPNSLSPHPASIPKLEQGRREPEATATRVARTEGPASAMLRPRPEHVGALLPPPASQVRTRAYALMGLDFADSDVLSSVFTSE